MGAQSSKDSLSSCSETLPDRSLKHNKSPSHRRLSSSSSENNNIKNSSRSPSLHNRSVGASGRNVFTQHDEALLLSRPLPLTPSYPHDSDSDSAITGSSLSVDVIRGKHFNTAMRHSLHPILPPSMLDSAVEFAESGPSPFPLFMVVYDFIACGEGQLSIKKGEMLHFISYNQSQEWCEVQALTRGEIGWVPASYITPVLNHQLNAHNPPMNNSKENDTPLPSDLSKCTWYHGPTSRQEAEAILSCGVNGSFLVRESETAPGKWSISLRFDGKVYHYRINETCDGLHKLYIQPEAQFQTLNSLIQYHCEYSGGLVSTLLFPAPRNSQSKEHGLSSSTSLSSFLHGKNEGASSFRPDGDVWEVDKSELNMKSKIGAGQYGEVYEAVWKRHNIRVAVKTLKQDYMEVDEFMQEAHIMKKLCHPNLVRLYGVCTRELPVLTVLEFMGNGNLLDYLRHEKRKIHVKDLLYMAKQVASAMNYLESLNYIHRDLAARNVLLSVNGNDHTVKIADFGLARKVSDKNEDGGYYVAHAGAKFPIKWTAPEGLAYNKFSSQSDVWAFGVLLWEMATFGESPYPGMDITEVYQKLETGYRMPAP